MRNLADLAIYAIILAAVVAAAVTGGVTLASGADVYAIDTNHPLATHEAVETYQDEGYVHGDVPGLNMSISVSQTHDQVGLTGWGHTDINRHYLRVQYNESIERTVRFYIPAGMWHPYVSEGVDAENTDVTADLFPTDDGDYTAVTIHLTGETDAVIPISVEAATVFRVRDATKSVVENLTGLDLPSWGGEQWQYLPETAFTSQNTTTALKTNDSGLRIQYDALLNSTEERWISVPQCSEAVSDDPVCRFTRTDSGDVYLMRRSNESVTIRYRHGSGVIPDVSAVVNELVEGVDRFLDDIQEAI